MSHHAAEAPKGDVQMLLRITHVHKIADLVP